MIGVHTGQSGGSKNEVGIMVDVQLGGDTLDRAKLRLEQATVLGEHLV